MRVGPATLAGQQLFDKTAISDLTTASPKYVVNLGALWNIDKLAINLRESVYGSSSEYVNDGGATLGSAVTYYQNKIGITPITNIDLSYQVLKDVKLSVGALNVFNRYPNKTNRSLDAAYRAALYKSAAAQYPSFSPFGINGGYYYLRANYSF